MMKASLRQMSKSSLALFAAAASHASLQSSVTAFTVSHTKATNRYASSQSSSMPMQLQPINVHHTKVSPLVKLSSSTILYSTLNLHHQTELEREMTRDALTITMSAIEAVNPFKAVHSHLQLHDSNIKLLDRSTGEFYSYDLTKYETIFISSFGKAASSMALATAQILTSSQTKYTPSIRGMVITKDDHASQDQIDELASHNIKLKFASHPIPDERSIAHSKDLLAELESLDERTLVVNCISGGGSALFCAPSEPLDLSHMSKLNQILLACGMPITDMNVLRKKVDVGKGGGLVKIAYPAKCITMVLSDVIGDPLHLIASGPSVKDSSTWSEAWDLVDRYGLSDKLPIEILDILKEGRDNETKIQHKTSLQNNDDSVFDESKTVLVGNNALAVSAAASESKILGYNPVVLGTSIEGEAADIANMYVSMAQEIQLQRTNPSLSTFPLAILPVALIAGGETTVTLTENSGKGGRNQEIGLAAGLKLRDCNLRDIVIISVGTDGTDGPTDAAGAVVDGGTIERVELSNNFTFKGDNALRTHDAYNFFGASKDNSALVKTGATGTNVADVCVILIK